MVERTIRSKKSIVYVYKFTYFVSSVSWGYYILKDQDYLPPSLGGKGEIANAWKNFDAPVHAPGMKMYTLVTMGYHVGGLV